MQTRDVYVPHGGSFRLYDVVFIFHPFNKTLYTPKREQVEVQVEEGVGINKDEEA